MIRARQIGWNDKTILLWKIAKQLERLGGVWSKVTITDVEEGGIPEGAILKKGDDGYLKTKDGSGYILQKL